MGIAMNSMKTSAQLILLLVYIISIISTSSAPDYSTSRKPHGTDMNALMIHYTKYSEEIVNDAEKHHTRSDAMELYSISAKKVLRVREKKGKSSYSYDPVYELVVTDKKGFKQNKFVTETISFRRLRIKSQDNDRYLCVKNGQEITFKSSVINRHKKPRKRCQFTWDFTNKMHIQLSITPPKGEKLYLTVQDGMVSLTQKHESTERERSFIWVPTRNARNVGSANNKRKRHTTSNAERGFPIGNIKDNITCDKALVSNIFKKSNRIAKLKTQISELEQKLKEAMEKEP